MWTLRVLLPGVDEYCSYICDIWSARLLFEVLKEKSPGAHFQLENTLDGVSISPHDGSWFPEWFNREGLTGTVASDYDIQQWHETLESRIEFLLREFGKDKDIPI